MGKKLFGKLADTSKTNRSLKEPFDLYWTVRLFHTIRTDKSMTCLDFLKLFSNKALLEGYYQQFKEGRLTCNCLHCKLRSDCITVMLQRGVALLETVDFNNYINITTPTDYYKLYREYTDIICDAVYRKKFRL